MYNYKYKICIINNDKKNDNAKFLQLLKDSIKTKTSHN